MSVGYQVLLFFFTGALFGTLKPMLVNILSMLSELVKAIIFSTYKRYKISKGKSIAENKIIKTIIDIAFFIFLGICGICLNYVSTDGVFRVYLVVFIIIGYKIGELLLSKIFIKALSLLYFILMLLEKIIYGFLFPIRFTLKLIIKVIVKLNIRIKHIKNNKKIPDS